MAVNFKMKNTTVSAIFGTLSVPKDKLDKFNAFNLKMDMDDEGIKFTSPTGSTAIIPGPAVAMGALKQGKLGPTTAAYMKKSIVTLIDALPATPIGWDGQLQQPEGVTATQEDAATGKEHIAAAANALGSVDVYPMAKLHTGPLMKLRDAQMMYQPVQGSGATSRYWVIALSDAFKVAARWQQATLSIRVEGKKVAIMQETLSSLGFNKVSGDYASVHLQVGTDVLLANRTLGAIVASLSEFTAILTPVPNAKVVKSK